MYSQYLKEKENPKLKLEAKRNFRSYNENNHNLHRELFTNYIDIILTFFDHLPPCIDIFKHWQKMNIFGPLTYLVLKRSLWTTLWLKLAFYQVAFEGMLFYSRANWNNFVNWGMNTTLWISESRESRLFVLLGLLAVLSEVFLVG